MVVSVAPPVPGHLHALNLPTSGIDDEPLTPTAWHVAQNARRRSRWAILGLSTPKKETSISLNSLHEHTKPRRSEGCEASQRPAIWAASPAHRLYRGLLQPHCRPLRVCRTRLHFADRFRAGARRRSGSGWRQGRVTGLLGAASSESAAGSGRLRASCCGCGGVCYRVWGGLLSGYVS